MQKEATRNGERQKIQKWYLSENTGEEEMTKKVRGRDMPQAREGPGQVQ